MEISAQLHASLNSLCAQVEDVSAKRKDPELLFHNKTSEQIKPKKKEQPVQPEEALYGMENIEQRIAGEPSSLTTCNSKSATQTVPDSVEGSQQLYGQLIQWSLADKAETVEVLLSASPSDLQSASDFLDLSEKFPLTLQQREAISRRHHLKFITGHYGSGKVTISHTCNWYMYTRI